MGSFSYVLLFLVCSQATANFNSFLPKYISKKYNEFKDDDLDFSSSREQNNPTNVKTAGVKTKSGVKTKTLPANVELLPTDPPDDEGGDWFDNAAKDATFEGGCLAAPPQPLNSKMPCTFYSGCYLSCDRGYELPNGAYRLYLVCQDAIWKVHETGSELIPSCKPVCSPPCQNQGICIAPDQCECQASYSGPQCQFEKKPCLNQLPVPYNAMKRCRANSCTISCMDGYEFPDGTEIVSLECKDGLWLPDRPNWVSVPDCQATCNPPCKNGGVCLSFNMCQCPQDFRGPQCQYEVEACNPAKLNFNGGYNCSGDGETFTCSGFFCAKGMTLNMPAEPSYTCRYSEGFYYPLTIPQCVVVRPDLHYGGSVTTIQNGGFGGYGDVITGNTRLTEKDSYQEGQQTPLVVIEDKSPTPGMCFYWGGVHFKTFDGAIYSFDSRCAHTLIKDGVDNTFSIVEQNSPGCFGEPGLCHSIIRFYLQNDVYTLSLSDDGHPIISSKGKILPIPGQRPGIRVDTSAHYVVVVLDSVGTTLKWDGQQLIQVDVKESLWNRTRGLCGLLDGNPGNDVLTKDGFNPNNIVTFASSWQVNDVGEQCKFTPTEEHACVDDGVQGSLTHNATQFCIRVLSNTRFDSCKHILDLTLLTDACRWDYCGCRADDHSKCICDMMNVYVRECKQRGVTDLVNWRDENTCPMTCTGGKIYNACGTSQGQPVCGASDVKEEASDECLEGCFCPRGTVFHDNECITVDECPCKLRGKEFPPGASVPKECNSCVCLRGLWVCTQVSCGSRCSAIGDPHYTTFDGRRFDFMGQCSYYMVKAQNFSIEGENVACQGSISLTMNFPQGVSSELPSCTKTITIRTDGQIIKLKQNRDVLVNGADLRMVPYEVAGIRIRSISSLFIQVQLPNGIKIWWDGMTRVYIDIPASFTEITRGLCGTFNHNQKDDFLTPEGDIEQTAIAFANKWKTHEQCEDVPQKFKSHPCDINIHKKATAEEYCNKLKSPIFADCHFHVDYEQYYQDCLYDMCSCESAASKCLCPIISAYGQECSDKGIRLDWRDDIRECAIQCPGGQKYQICGNPCTRSCFDISTSTDCKEQCVEGCNCPEGEALDDGGECIPIGQCNCRFNGLDFPPDYKEVRPASRGQELCTCVHGIWNCEPAQEKDIARYPQASDVKSRCKATDNFEFTTCEPIEPITCKNMHTPPEFTPAICHNGCKCKSGFVLESTTGKCVRPTECPCHHGGQSYKENGIVQNDCNTCTCKNGKWDCTDRLCAAECVAWGDSHFKTFDGKHYDYQGQCDYVLSKGNFGSSESFDISIQNVPCGSLGTSCSKAVTIRISAGPDTDTVVLTAGTPLPEFTISKHVSIRQQGLFVIVEAAEIGLTIRWDRGTRVYVRLGPKWKNKVKGLCGNYNNNELDDFQTPSGGITEVSPTLFGDSWKLHTYCPEAREIVDTCGNEPDRKVWAMKKCGVLKSSLFSSCHAEVSIDSFYDKCLFDTCACNLGGDCECLCTALAAYAQECNSRGVPIKWRSQELCPIQCDEKCSVYSPCISPCPVETCDNILTNTKLSLSCSEETCIEGCELKNCPPGQVYTNSSHTECVAREICKPKCLEINGTVYYEGDLIEGDDCHDCFCSRGEKVCKGIPCLPPALPTPIPQYTTPTMHKDQLMACTTGWSEWINQDVTYAKKSSRAKDVEPLPTAIVMGVLKTGGRCDIEKMVDIECRTVKSQISAKETGLDVECSLERGLVCESNTKGKACPDFEIRVLCQCEEPTTPKPSCDVNAPNREHPTDCHLFYQCVPDSFGVGEVEKSCGEDMMYNPITMTCDFVEVVAKIKPECRVVTTPLSTEETVGPDVFYCGPNARYEECAKRCDEMCLNFVETFKEQGVCLKSDECISGCVPKTEAIRCPKGQKWANNNTCIPIQDCMCRSKDGTAVKPGLLYNEPDCKVCQCIDNYYACHDSVCATEEPIVVATNKHDLESHPLKLLEVHPFTFSSLTPPPKCEPNRFIDLIQGKKPLPDSAFSSSSSKNNFFYALNARLDNTPSAVSGGSWKPSPNDESPYLEIDLGRQEPIYGIKIRGNPASEEWVTSYIVNYSPTGEFFGDIVDELSKPRLFKGSVDSNTTSVQLFDEPIEARIVQIIPLAWINAPSLRVELIGCEKHVTTTTPRPPPPMLKPMCDEPMGPGDDIMSNEQYQVSSVKDLEHSKTALQMDSDSYWQPLYDSPTEWIEFDFYQNRNVTGVVTRGGPDGWVTAYSVIYSHDGIQWNTIIDPKTNAEYLFRGNFDSTSPRSHYFEYPISCRYLKVIPRGWYNTIQLKLQLRGCYEPYPEMTTTIVTTEPTTPLPCLVCPDLENEMEIGACKCPPGLWWNGVMCAARHYCPCIISHISYSVGTSFSKSDCSECVCKMGGVPHCKPKECEKCDQGLRSIITRNCSCSCQPCPDSTRLCPTSNICIDEKLWCDGVQNCPDDEVDCVITTTPEEENDEEGRSDTCPMVYCPAKYKRVLIRNRNRARPGYSSRMFNPSKGVRAVRKRSVPEFVKTKSAYKTAAQAPRLNLSRRPAKAKGSSCAQFKCVSTAPPPKYIVGVDECPAAECPEGLIPSQESPIAELNSAPFLENVKQPQKSPSGIKTKTVDLSVEGKTCPIPVCIPPPPPDSICEVTGRTFNTFDGTEYKYDICNHGLARDLQNYAWEISLKKNCSETCTKDLVIRLDDQLFEFHPDLTVEYDGYSYTAEQLQEIGARTGDFGATRLGSVILFTSPKNGFWVEWTVNSNVKIGVVRSLSGTVDGLCGFFDEEPSNDKSEPDGVLSRTTEEFGDSWSIINGQPLICTVEKCPVDAQNRAWEICNKVKSKALAACSKTVNLDAFLSRCLETVCDCLGQNATHEISAGEKCKCQILQSYVVDCLTADSSIDISDWRRQFNCPSTCVTPLVHHDCYQRKCEPTCETLSDVTACPKINNVCFPGCYCPSELVKKGDLCIKPSECRDCECKLEPNLDYFTYDETNFTVSGNCVYVMSRDLVPDKHNEHNFQVLITNGPCLADNDKMCVAKVTILYKGHKIFIIADTIRNKLRIIIDGERVEDLKVDDWLKIEQTTTNDLKILLIEAQIVVTIRNPSLAVMVNAPSYKYSGRLEGLCGDCNRNPNDDLRLPDGNITDNVVDFGLGWLFEDLPGGQTREMCEIKPKPECPILEADINPCVNLVDNLRFGKCHAVVDPLRFIEWCNKDTCGGHPEAACDSIEAYARECTKSGICVDWHTNGCPAPTCPSDKIFKPCGTACPKTCQDLVDPKEKPVEQLCKEELTEGCFCPDEKVLWNGTCVPERECIVCDKEGHHPGDSWIKDKCTSCQCEGSSLQCQTKECPATVCEKGFEAVKVPTQPTECCDQFSCIPEPTVAPTCEPPQPLNCGRDKIVKVDEKPDGCVQFICQCVPLDQCQEVNENEVVKEGFEKLIDKSDCCPRLNIVCNLEKCSKPPVCEQFYHSENITLDGSCCPLYTCLPPEDKCIFESLYMTGKQGGERPRTDLEKMKVLKALGEKWEDGPCRQCKCKDIGDVLQPVCTKTECPAIESSSDYADYKLEIEPIYNQCCPKIKRVACKVNETIYNTGEDWFANDDFCTLYKCAESPNGDISKERHIISCDTTCHLGYEYVPAPKDSGECCGVCKPVACVIDGSILMKLNQEWASIDFCKKSKCINVNGSVQVQSSKENCPLLSEERSNNFVINEVVVAGKCCKKYETVACKSNGTEYQVGEEWTEGQDYCTVYRCSRDTNGEIVKETTMTGCDTKCRLGFEYFPAPEDLKQCCGKCKPVACVFGEALKKVDEEWSTVDYCTKFKCVSAQGSLQLESKNETCLPMPEDQLKNFEVKATPVPGKCCKKYEKTACKVDNVTYREGEEWFENSDYCAIHKCVKNSDGELLKETHITNCDTTCRLGYQYFEAPLELQKCCGICKPIACVDNGALRRINEEWQSVDFCTQYRCSDVNGSMQIESKEVNCPILEEDYLRKFVVEAEHVPGQCCKNYTTIACKVNNATYKPGEEWVMEDDYCTEYKCVKSPVGNFTVQTTIRNCDTTCRLGYEYNPAYPGSGKCCGVCRPVACVVDEALKRLNDEWDSPDHCTKYKCIDVGGSMQVEASNITCPTIPEEHWSNFEIKIVPVPGKCCKKHELVACKVNKQVYQVDEEWIQEDDYCKIYKCITSPNGGELTKQTHITTCDTTCRLGFQYFPAPAELKKCCGICKPVACVDDTGELRKIDEVWESSNHCRKYKCSAVNGTLQVESTDETCPQLDGDFLSKYVVKSTKVEGKCCERQEVVACKVNNIEYQLGDEWVDGDDYCTVLKCTKTPSGNFTIDKTITGCDTSCREGYQYHPAPPELQKCCGICKPFACVVNGTVRKPTETWVSDDYCTEYVCVEAEDGSMQTQAKAVSCPGLSEDYSNNYEIKIIPVKGQCCKKFEVIGCKANDEVYKVDEEWLDGNDSCTVYKCSKNPNGDVTKETHVTTCDSSCRAGYEYFPAPRELEKCCGICKPVACVTEDGLRKVDERWVSEDNCVKYKCLYQNGSMQVESKKEVCPLVGEDYLENVQVQYIPVEGQCCKRIEKIACKVGPDVYKVGTVWKSPDGDLCKNITCVQTDGGELVKQESTETCNEDCPVGWVYEKSSTSCCGKCVEIACVFEGNLRNSGDVWHSEDNCTSFTCEKTDEHYVVTGSQEKCPSVRRCPAANVYIDGCCKRCNITAESQKQCTTEALPLDKTINLLKIENYRHGMCVNKEPINGFTQCLGACESHTSYQTRLGKFTSVCNCCQAVGFEVIKIDMVCADGFTWVKSLEVPSQCLCTGCSNAQSAAVKSNAKTKTKTKSRQPAKSSYTGQKV